MYSRPRCPHGHGMAPLPSLGAGLAQAAFDGTPYGSGYLFFSVGEKLEMLQCRSEDEGWAWGRRLLDGSVGWFPPSFWRQAEDDASGGASKTVAKQLEVSEKVYAAPQADVSSAERAGMPESLVEAESVDEEQAGYGREQLLHVRSVLLLASEGRAADESASDAERGWHLGIAMQPVPREFLPRLPLRELTPGEALVKLLEAAGGHAKVGNLTAACVALGVKNLNLIAGRGHSSVAADILSEIRQRPDIFSVPAELPRTGEADKLVVTLLGPLAPPTWPPPCGDDT